MDVQQFKTKYPHLSHLEGNDLWNAMEDAFLHEHKTDIPKEVLIDKVKYCAFVVYCMTNPEYKKREYTKKLYKFIDTL